MALFGPNVLAGDVGQVISIPRVGGLPNVLVSDETLKNSDANLDIEILVASDSILLIGAAGRSGYYRIVRLSLETGEHAIIGHVERGTLLAAVGDTAYCSQNSSLLCSLPIKGGPRRTIRWNIDAGSTIADTAAIYICDRRSKSLLRYTPATQSMDVLLWGIAQDATLVQDDTNLFVSSGGAIRRLAKNGNPPVTMIYAGQNPRVIAVAGDTVFFVDGAIKAVSNVGGTPRTLVSNINVAGATADGRFIYVAATKDDGSGAVYRIEYTS